MSPLRKIADADMPCLHGEHKPPSYISLSPGTCEHVCPACGESTEFTVPLVLC